MPKLHLILRGGRVLDPANGLDEVRDVGIVAGRVKSVAPELDPTQAVADPETGQPTMSLVASQVNMLEDCVSASGGTLLVTKAGEAAAKDSGLGYSVVDLTQSKLYRGWN